MTEKTLRQLADLVGGEVRGDPELKLRGVGAIEEAQPGEITFLSNPKYARFLASTRASAVILTPDLAEGAGDRPLLLTAAPYLAFARIQSSFAERPYVPGGVSPEAWVSPSARLGREVTIHPLAYVGDRAEVGDRTTLHPGVVLGEEARVGSDCVLHPNVTLYPRSILGDRVILHAGVVVGADGFGYAPAPEGLAKIPQTGIVVIEDDVEIGANTTVDRAALGRTVVGRGTKIDNGVQVGHNVRIGEHCILVAHVAIAGSTRLGRGVQLGGQVGLAGHLELGDGVRVAAQSGVGTDLPAGATVGGSPAFEHTRWLRASVAAQRLPELRHAVRDLERRLEALEKGAGGDGKARARTRREER